MPLSNATRRGRREARPFGYPVYTRGAVMGYGEGEGTWAGRTRHGDWCLVDVGEGEGTITLVGCGASRLI